MHRRLRQAGILIQYLNCLWKNVAGLALDPIEEWRLRRKIRRGEVRSVRCLAPFTQLEFLGHGVVAACCQAFTREIMVGNMRWNNIEGIWNGRALRRFRRRMLLGDLDKICRANCPSLKSRPVVIREIHPANQNMRALKDDLLAGRTRLRARPAYFNLSNWGACNLNCIMCYSRDNGPMPAHARKTLNNIKRFFDGNLTINLAGAGDPLARADTRELLMNFPADRHPGVEFQILTNGTLWTRATWEKIKHCRFGRVNVSVDAATRETYERIRRGAKWDDLLAALALFREQRDTGRIRGVMINMTVMRGNYREIPQFVELARHFGFIASFAPIRGDFGDENIFDRIDRQALDELRRIFARPDLQGPDVDTRALAPYLSDSL